MRTPLVVPVVLAIAFASASAQTAAPNAKPPAPIVAGQGSSTPPAAGAPTPAPTPPDNYTYQADGRRDPFLNLLGTGSEPRGGAPTSEGAGGLTVAEISVSGVLESRGALIAMVQGPDKKTYIVHQGDKFADGT